MSAGLLSARNTRFRPAVRCRRITGRRRAGRAHVAGGAGDDGGRGAPDMPGRARRAHPALRVTYSLRERESGAGRAASGSNRRFSSLHMPVQVIEPRLERRFKHVRHTLAAEASDPIGVSGDAETPVVTTQLLPCGRYRRYSATGGDEASQVPGQPLHACHSQTPAEPGQAFGLARLSGASISPSALRTASASAITYFEAQSHGLQFFRRQTGRGLLSKRSSRMSVTSQPKRPRDVDRGAGHPL